MSGLAVFEAFAAILGLGYAARSLAFGVYHGDIILDPWEWKVTFEGCEMERCWQQRRARWQDMID